MDKTQHLLCYAYAAVCHTHSQLFPKGWSAQPPISCDSLLD